MNIFKIIIGIFCVFLATHNFKLFLIIGSVCTLLLIIISNVENKKCKGLQNNELK